MGPPMKIMVKGHPVFVCCKGCEKDALKDPDKTLKKVEEFKKSKLSAEDLALVVEQKLCPISGEPLGGEMGTPIKLTIKGKPVFICCKSCEKAALKDPDKTLQKVEELKKGDGKKK